MVLGDLDYGWAKQPSQRAGNCTGRSWATLTPSSGWPVLSQGQQWAWAEVSCAWAKKFPEGTKNFTPDQETYSSHTAHLTLAYNIWRPLCQRDVYKVSIQTRIAKHLRKQLPERPTQPQKDPHQESSLHGANRIGPSKKWTEILRRRRGIHVHEIKTGCYFTTQKDITLEKQCLIDILKDINKMKIRTHTAEEWIGKLEVWIMK